MIAVRLQIKHLSSSMNLVENVLESALFAVLGTSNQKSYFAPIRAPPRCYVCSDYLQVRQRYNENWRGYVSYDTGIYAMVSLGLGLARSYVTIYQIG